MKTPMAVAALAAALLLSGCASGAPTAATSAAPSGSSTTQSGKDEAIAKMLPAEIVTAGKVRVASAVGFPPMEEFADDGKTIVGFDADLGKALGDVMGVTFEFSNVDFDGVIGSLDAGRQDLAMTAMVDKKSRQDKVDFVDYLNSGYLLMVKSADKDTYSDELALCGKSIAVEKGTFAVDTAEAIGARCVAAGKATTTVVQLPKQENAVTALDGGRADANIALDVTVIDTAKKSEGKFVTVGKPMDPVPLGIAIPKKSTQLRDAVQAALKKLQADGVYDDLLAEYGLSDLALEGAPLNSGS